MPRPRNEPTDIGLCSVHGQVPAAPYKAGHDKTTGKPKSVWRCSRCRDAGRSGTIGFCEADNGHGPCRRPAGHPPDHHLNADGQQWPAAATTAPEPEPTGPEQPEQPPEPPSRDVPDVAPKRVTPHEPTRNKNLESRPSVTNPKPTIDLFSVIPDLVIDLLGGPAIVVEVDRHSDTEVATLTVRNEHGDHEIAASWATGQRVTVLGIAVDGTPENIELWDSHPGII